VTIAPTSWPQSGQRLTTCPVCGGHGTTQKPPWVAGDQREWVASTMRLYSCPACAGQGIIFVKEEGA
jgi:hypothetical protein